MMFCIQSQKKFDLLMDITETNIDRLLQLAEMPIYKEFVWPIILHMLASIQHSPIVLDRVLKLYAKSSPLQLTNNPQLAEQLVDTIAALLLHFPNRPETDAVVGVCTTNQFEGLHTSILFCSIA